MQIPHEKITPATLKAIIQEFVTRDGTDDSVVELRVEAVLNQLAAGQVALYFDEASGTCNFVRTSE